MMADEAGAFALENVLIHALAVDVVHKDRVTILVRPGAAQIDHGAAMGVAAAGVVRAAVALMRRVADVMAVVGDRLNVGICVWIHMLAGLPLVSSTLNHVVEVRDH